jgi:hypothetical protein
VAGHGILARFYGLALRHVPFAKVILLAVRAIHVISTLQMILVILALLSLRPVG